MGQLTQKAASSSEQSAAASEELSAQAESMRGIVRQLEVLIDGAGGHNNSAKRRASFPGYLFRRLVWQASSDRLAATRPDIARHRARHLFRPVFAAELDGWSPSAAWPGSSDPSSGSFAAPARRKP